MNIANEAEIIKELLKNPDTHYINECFAYIPMRLTGLGLTERIINDKAMIFNRTKENFASDEFMKTYANILICMQHPLNEKGEFEPLNFKHAKDIIGNAIHSFLRENEIWIIARIYNPQAVELILNNNYSTSPYFISKEVQHEIENDVIYNEIPLICNHLAIVEKGFWDKKSNDIKPISKEQNMENEKIDTQEVEATKADTEVKEIDTQDNQETKADDTQELENTQVDDETENTQKAGNDISALIDEINALKAQVDVLMQNQDTNKSDEDLQEKDEIIEAINEIADSNEIIERIRVRNADSAKDILQKFLKSNKKHVSEKYHTLIDSIPQNAYSLAKNDILQDLKNNAIKKNQMQDIQTNKGWQLHNNEIKGYKF